MAIINKNFIYPTYTNGAGMLLSGGEIVASAVDPGGDVIGGVVTFIAQYPIVGAAGSVPSGLLTYYESENIALPEDTAEPGGTVLSGNLAGNDDFGIIRTGELGGQLAVVLLIPFEDEIEDPQHGYFTTLNIEGVTNSILDVDDCNFEATPSEDGNIHYCWNWAGFSVAEAMEDGQEYVAQFGPTSPSELSLLPLYADAVPRSANLTGPAILDSSGQLSIYQGSGSYNLSCYDVYGNLIWTDNAFVAPDCFTDRDGNPLQNGIIRAYTLNTTQPIDTFADASGTLNSWPLVLSVEGTAGLYLDDDNNYRLEISDENDVMLKTVNLDFTGNDFFPFGGGGGPPAGEVFVNERWLSGAYNEDAQTLIFGAENSLSEGSPSYVAISLDNGETFTRVNIRDSISDFTGELTRTYVTNGYMFVAANYNKLARAHSSNINAWTECTNLPLYEDQSEGDIGFTDVSYWPNNGVYYALGGYQSNVSPFARKIYMIYSTDDANTWNFCTGFDVLENWLPGKITTAGNITTLTLRRFQQYSPDQAWFYRNSGSFCPGSMTFFFQQGQLITINQTDLVFESKYAYNGGSRVFTGMMGQFAAGLSNRSTDTGNTFNEVDFSGPTFFSSSFWYQRAIVDPESEITIEPECWTGVGYQVIGEGSPTGAVYRSLSPTAIAGSWAIQDMSDEEPFASRSADSSNPIIRVSSGDYFVAANTGMFLSQDQLQSSVELP